MEWLQQFSGSSRLAFNRGGGRRGTPAHLGDAAMKRERRLLVQRQSGAVAPVAAPTLCAARPSGNREEKRGFRSLPCRVSLRRIKQFARAPGMLLALARVGISSDNRSIGRPHPVSLVGPDHVGGHPPRTASGDHVAGADACGRPTATAIPAFPSGALKRGLAALVVVLLLAAALVGATPGSTRIPEELERTAEALESGKKAVTVVATVTEPLALGEGNVPLGMQRVIDAKSRHGRHLVVVQKAQDSGQGGAVLMLLADSQAIVHDNATVSTLPRDILESARTRSLCGRRSLCQLLDERRGRPGKVEASQLRSDLHIPADEKTALKNAGADSATAPLHTLTFPHSDPAGGIGPTEILLTLLAAGAALFSLAVLRTRYRAALVGPAPPPLRPPSGPLMVRVPPEPPAAARLVPEGPVRPATVCTRLHPQGYVELDGWLYRASWADPHLAPPDPGEVVDIAGQRPGDLLAFVPRSLDGAGGPAG